MNKSIEENSIALNHALLLLRSYDEYKDNDEGAAVNETYLNEIERILDGIQSPEKRSPLKSKKENEIFIEYNANQRKDDDEMNEISEFQNEENEDNERKFEENQIFKKGEDLRIDKLSDGFEEKARKTKNCNIF